MNKCSCDSCLFSDQCFDNRPCEHYSPIDCDDIEIIEAGRRQFYADWFSYLEDAEASII